jgi:osmotically-inducible protein OsmY
MLTSKNLALPVLIVFLMILSLNIGCSSNVTPQQDGTASIQQLDTSKITAVKAKFAQDKILAGTTITIKVINNECTLEGTVPNQESKENAGKLAASVEGITKVNNNLKVKEEK